MKSRFTFSWFIAFFIIGSTLSAQTQDRIASWKAPMADATLNFYSIKQEASEHYRDTERELAEEQHNRAGKGGNVQGEENEAEFEGYFQYKRWEDFMEPRVFPSGDITLPSRTWEFFNDYMAGNPAAAYQYQRGQGGNNQRSGGPGNSIQSSTWTFVGPTGAPTGGGAGRVNFLRFDPTNTNTLWVGAPAGGLWKSTNGGTTWTTNTDFLTVIGATDVVIDPANTQTMYLATGDGDAGDTYSIGVMKSTDGGATWNTTGLTWTVNQGRTISKLLMNPTNPLIVMAFTSNGIYRTTNGGTNWTQVQNTNAFKDAEFQPGSSTTIYACGTTFWKSTDGGATWAAAGTGLPAAGSIDRMALAVSANQAGYVYALCGSAANDGFYGFYRSTDNGATFTQRSSTPNVLGWASAGNDTGGQGWYDLAVDADPTNANNVIVGGVNVWRSTNGGTSWTLNAHWTGSGAPYIHADVHSLNFLPGSSTTYFATSDGGVFKTTNNGGAWSDLSNNLCIAQPYRIGLSGSNANLWITGHQDNGTNIKNGASYAITMGGDGMDCFIDRTNNNVMYGEQYSGSLNRTTNGGANWTAITTGLSGTAPWVTPWYQDPTTANTIYCGRTNLFKSTNQGTNWTQLTALPASPAGTIVDFKVAPSNNQVIYVARAQGLFKTTNGGTSWTTVTGTLPVGSAYISRVDVKPTDPNTCVVTFSGYSSGNKVYRTTNGGTSWTNISTGLPNLPCNCVRFSPGLTNDAMYVGCDVGVYYMDNTFTSWQPYFISLPNVPVFDLEVYQATGKLRAATYGRGVWEVDIYNPGTLAPVADFTSNKTIVCAGDPVNFTDMSSFTPTSWSWAFQGGTPATSTAQNPTGITWSAAGTYSVTLTATNANGSDAEIKTGYITVLANATVPPLVEGFEAATFLPANFTAENINNDGVYWDRANAGFSSSWSARFDNYNNDVAGARDAFWCPRQSFASLTTAQISFDVAYARYDATYTDTLQVQISTDCGATWTQVYLKGGTTLATVPDQTTQFTPTAAQWRNEVVNLNTYVGQSSVIIRFVNRGHYGNCLFVDNINITGTAAALPNAAFTTSLTTACAGTAISFTDASTGSPTSWTWTFPSGTPASATTQNVASVTWSAAGTYTVTHTATNANGTGTQTVVITILASPAVTATSGTTTLCSGNSTTLSATGASTYNWMPGSLTGSPVTVTPAGTTTYTVTGTAANGCTGTATRTITVNPTPTVTVSTSTATICSGNSATLTATGATTYSWMPGSLTGSPVTVSPGSTTTYTVTGTSAGCSSIATQLITVNTSPTVTASSGTTTLCSGSSTTLSATGASTYNWMPGSLTGSPVSVTPASTTTYTVTGTAANGCTGTATQAITVNTSPTVTASSGTTTLCSGNSTTLSATGASTYNWMPGSLTGSPVTVTPGTTTTYTVTGTAANGCTGTATRTITVNPTPTVTVSSSTTTLCSGSSATLTATGGTTYSWMPGSLTGSPVTVTPGSTTTYTVTGTTGGCSSTATQAITVNTSPTVTASSGTTTLCSGNSTTLSATGASTYNWMPGSLTGSPVTVTPGSTTTYTVTGTAANGCTGTATRTITVNPTPTVTVSTSTATLCSGSSATLTATGATTYSWMPGSLTGSPVTVSPAGNTTYTVTGTSAGCSSTATQAISVIASPTVTASSATTTLCSGSSTTLSATGATTYNWMPGSLTGSPVTVTPASTTTYTVTGTAANGCTGSATRTITVNPSPTVTPSATNSSICTGGSTTLSATGASTYNWMPGNLNGASVSVTPAATTTYTVTGTAANGCTNAQTITITVGSQPTVTVTSNSSICSGSSITLTATGTSTYNWMPGNLSGSSVTVSPSATTTYTVTGTNAPGCSNTASVTVTVNPVPVVTASSSTTTVCSGSPVTFTGNGASTYNWMPGSLSGTVVTDSPAANTTYTVTGTDVNGCTDTYTFSISVNALPNLTVTPTSTTICAGGSVTLSGTPTGGPYTFLWSPTAGLSNPNAASTSASPTSTTTYVLTKTNTTTGCARTGTAVVTVNPAPAITPSASSTTICTGNTVTLNGAGANTYNWMPGNLNGSSVSVTPAATTTYTVTGTDLNGCTGTQTITINVGSQPTVNASSSSPSICIGGNATLSATGTTSYTWMPGNLTGSSVVVTPTVTTTYTVTGDNGPGCSNTATITVTVNGLPNVTASSSASTTCAGDAVTLTGSGAAAYTWMPGSLTGSPVTDNPTSSTTYTVTGTDVNGCSNTGTVAITVNTLPTVTASSSASSSCAGDAVTLTGNGASTYNWMPGSLTGSPVIDNPTTSTTYTVTGTDMNGCSSTATVAVAVNQLPNVTIALAMDTFCAADGALMLSGGSPAGGTYSGPGVTGNMFDASSVGIGTYTIVYTYTDSSGCTNTAQQNVVVDICNGFPAGTMITETLEVLPNPSDGEFILTFNVSKRDNYVIEIHNELGQIVYAERLDNFAGTYSNKINLKEYGRGAYTIRLRSSDNEIIERIITF